MKIVINAGHTKSGVGTGASKYLNESIETRKIAYELMKLLTDTTHEVVPAVFDKSSNNLKEAVELANKEKADLFISVHLNAGGGSGCEAYTHNAKNLPAAYKMCKKLEKLGFKNRGIKNGSNLYVIKYTNMSSLLFEVCFVDNKEDAVLYNKVGSEKIAKAIFDSIV